LILLAFAIVAWGTSEASAATGSNASTAALIAATTTTAHGYRAYYGAPGNYRLYRDYGPYTSYRYSYPPRYSVYRYGYARPYRVYRPYYGYGGFGYYGPRVVLRFGY